MLTKTGIPHRWGGDFPPAVVHQIEKRACDDAILSKVLDALGRIIEK